MSILAAENDDPMPFLKPQFMLSQKTSGAVRLSLLNVTRSLHFSCRLTSQRVYWNRTGTVRDHIGPPSKSLIRCRATNVTPIWKQGWLKVCALTVFRTLSAFIMENCLRNSQIKAINSPELF